MHLDAVPNDLACAPFDLTFTTVLAWPPTSGWGETAAFTTTCGLTGEIALSAGFSDHEVVLSFDAPTAACGLDAGETFVIARLWRTQPQPTFVCAPLLMHECAGAHEYEGPSGCEGVRTTEFAVAAASFNYVRGYHHCTNGVEDAWFGVRNVDIYATEASCTAYVGLGFTVLSSGCPSELGELVYETDWSTILP